MELLISLAKLVAALVGKRYRTTHQIQAQPTGTCSERCPTCGACCTVLAGYAHDEHTHMTKSGPPYWGSLHLWIK
jgi:hypothetical protein